MSIIQKRHLILSFIRFFLTSGLVFVGIISLIFVQAMLMGTGFPFNAESLCFFYIAIVSTLSIYKKTDVFCFRFIRRLFRKSNKELAHDLMFINNKVNSILDLRELSNLVVNTLSETFSCKNVSLLVLSDDDSMFVPASSSGMKIMDMPNLSLPVDDILIVTAKKLRTVLYRKLINKSLSWQEATAASHSFGKLRAHYVFPFFYEGDLIGLLGINARTGGDRLSAFEMQQMKNFVKQLSSPVQNARKYTRLLKQMEELKSSQSQVLQNAKLFAMEKLASGIAHEIHNPLTIISGKAQVMLLKGSKRYDPDRVQNVLETIVEQTKRAADITRRLLMFTKGKDKKGNRLINIENVINDTISLVSYQTSLDSIKIMKVLESDMPMFEGNLFEIRELFLNLTLNAIQAVEKEGSIVFNAKFITSDNIIKVSITDTGHGIEAEHIPFIFDPFYTTSQEKAGLGLFVCQQIVHRIGGALKVESRINEGTAFIISIPVAQKYLRKSDDDIMFDDDIIEADEFADVPEDEESSEESSNNILKDNDFFTDK